VTKDGDTAGTGGREEEEEEEEEGKEGGQKAAHTITMKGEERETPEGSAGAAGGRLPLGPSRAVAAMFRKNLTLQSRQSGQVCCQVVTPLLVMGLLLLLQLIIKSQLGDDLDTKTLLPTIPFPLNRDIADCDKLPEVLRKGLGGEVCPTMPHPHSGAANCLEFFLYGYEQGETGTAEGGEYGAAPEAAAALGATLRSKIPTKQCQVAMPSPPPVPGTRPKYPYKTESVPYFLYAGSKTSLNGLVVSNITHLNTIDKGSLYDQPHPANELADGTILVNKYDPPKASVGYTLATNDLLMAQYHRANNFTRLDIGSHYSHHHGIVLTDPPRLSLMEMIHSSMQEEAGVIPPRTPASLGSEGLTPKGLGIFVSDLIRNALNVQFAQVMPKWEQPDILVIVEIFGSFLYPLVLSLQLPVYLYVAVMEKEERLTEMQLCMGCRPWVMYTTTVALNLSFYAAVVAFFWLGGLYIEIRFFCETSPALLFLFFAGWGSALVSLGLVLSACLNSKRAATVVGYVVALVGTLITLVFCDGIYGDIPGLSLGARLPRWLLLWPQFGLTRGVYILNFACAAKLECIGSLNQVSWGDEMSDVLVSLYADALLCLLLGLYLDQVLPRTYGVPRHPLFFLPEASSLWRSGPSAATPTPGTPRGEGGMQEDILEPLAAAAAAAAVGGVVGGGDSHLDSSRSLGYGVAEEAVASSGTGMEEAPVVIRGLRKVYPSSNPEQPDKVAVSDLWLSVRRGEVLGLLGHNGAGKTTTIQVLTGLHEKSEGLVSVGGHPLPEETPEAHLVMGLCPQHDVLWESLTVSEHILYYLRLKGVPREYETIALEQSLEDVNLKGKRHSHASELSGGMRRRLSIAISLAGSPAIVFLDEPTTGLDPKSRRGIWRVLAEQRSRGRSMILTTHSMEEAEVLSSRIAIMAHGRLRCIGSQSRLKQALGGGYRITINYPAGKREEVDALMARVYPGGSKQRDFQGSALYLAPSAGGGSVASLFRAMESAAREGLIEDWGIGQATLEDVFIKVTEDAEEEQEYPAAN